MVSVFVVVGAGVAGCAAAAALAAETDDEVIVVEAGSRHGVHEDAWPVVTGPSGIATGYRAGAGAGGGSLINAGMVTVSTSQDHRLLEASGLPVERPAPGPLGAALTSARPDTESVRLVRAGGERIDVYRALLEPLVRSGRVRLVDGTVDRVVFDNTRAIGVQLGGAELAADGVVMAAGVFGTPTVLLRSACDSPGIGHGLRDQPSALLTVQPSAGPPRTEALTVVWRGRGIELLPVEALADGAHAGLAMALIEPHSVGSLELAGDEVTIDLGRYRDGRDLGAMVAAVRDALDLLDHRAFDGVIGGVTERELLGDEGSIVDWLRAAPIVHHHAVGTCSSAVAADGRLLGYDNVVIADASAMTRPPRSNPMLRLIAAGRATSAALRAPSQRPPRR